MSVGYESPYGTIRPPHRSRLPSWGWRTRLGLVGAALVVIMYAVAPVKPANAGSSTYQGYGCQLVVDCFTIHDWNVASFTSVEARYTIVMETGFRGYARWECNGYYNTVTQFSNQTGSQLTLNISAANTPSAKFIVVTGFTSCAFHIWSDAAATGRFSINNARFIVTFDSGGGFSSGDPTLGPGPTPGPTSAYTFCPAPTPTGYIGPPIPSVCALPTPTPTAPGFAQANISYGSTTNANTDVSNAYVHQWLPSYVGSSQNSARRAFDSGDTEPGTLRPDDGSGSSFTLFLGGCGDHNPCSFGLHFHTVTGTDTAGADSDGTSQCRVTGWSVGFSNSSTIYLEAATNALGTYATVATASTSGGRVSQRSLTDTTTYGGYSFWRLRATPDLGGVSQPFLQLGMDNVRLYGLCASSGGPEPSPTPSSGAPTLPPYTAPSEPPAPPDNGGFAMPTRFDANICPLPRPTPEIAACAPAATSEPDASFGPLPSSNLGGAIASFTAQLMDKAPFGYIAQAGDAIGDAIAGAAGADFDFCLGELHDSIGNDYPFCLEDFSADAAATGFRGYMATLVWIGTALAILFLVYAEAKG